VTDHGRREATEHERALAADDHEPGLGGERDAERGEDERRGAGQRVLPGERAGERAAVDERVDLERILPEHGHEEPEQRHGGRQRADRDRQRLGRFHTLPITPSTR